MKKLNNFRKFFGAGLLIALVLAFAFQNCTEMRLRPIEVQTLSSTSVSGSFCSMPPDSGADALNIIFVVDISNSNLWSSTGGPGTDKPGVRFNVVEDFLTSECVSKQARTRFAVYGFSDNTFGASCNQTMLGDATQAEAQIDDLRSKQAADAARPASGPFQYMKRTHYGNAFNCAKSIVDTHLSSLPAGEKSSNGYMVFFMTDGLPTDNLASGNYNLPATKGQIQPILESMMLNMSAAGGGRIQPIFYGQSALTPAEQPLATDIVDFISDHGDSVPVSVDNVDDIEFCALLASGRKTKYNLIDFGAINLTAKLRGRLLYPDSDMDGILDADESARGFDPSKARSGVNGNLLLDGLCPDGSQASACAPSTTCSKPNKMGLSDCDIAAYSLTDGLDSEVTHDFIPDQVEILKGTSANTSNRFENIDGDNLKLFEEIRMGRDPKVWDNDVPSERLVDARADLSTSPVSGCPANQESWNFRINHLPLVNTIATNATDSVSRWNRFYSHGANENVLLVYYIVGKAGDNPANPSPYFIFGQYVKVHYVNGRVPLGPFELLGTMNGTFAPVP